MGAYGFQGFDVIGNTAGLPSYATVTPTGQQSCTGAASTTDPRALQIAIGSGRIAACWYTFSSFTVNVNLTDGQTHDLQLNFLDWDSTARSETVQISNALTGAVLNTETATSFDSGVYLDWAVDGNVDITFTRLAGANAVLSGLFFDPTPTVGGESLASGATNGRVSSRPTVSVATPACGATNLAVSSSVSATFNEAVQSSTISFTLTNSAGTSVPAALSYNSSSLTVTLTPSSALAYGTAYTASVSGANDTAGDPMAGSLTRSFTTGASQPAINAGSPVTVNAELTLTFSQATEIGGTAPFACTWNFGDGENQSGSVNPSHTYPNPGSYTATFTVTDANKLTSSSSVVVTVNDEAPKETLADPSAQAGSPVSSTASASDVSPAVQAAGFIHTWNFGDGGTATVASPSHEFASAGTYTVTVTETDEYGKTWTTAGTFTNAVVNLSTGSTSVRDSLGHFSTENSSDLPPHQFQPRVGLNDGTLPRRG